MRGTPGRNCIMSESKGAAGRASSASATVLLCDLRKQNFCRVPAGTLDGTGLEGVCEVRIVQGLQVAAAAAGLAEPEIVLPGAFLVLACFFLNSIAPMVVSVSLM